MEFRLLGPLEVTHEGAPVLIDGRDRRLVLALLLAHANETRSLSNAECQRYLHVEACPEG